MPFRIAHSLLDWSEVEVENCPYTSTGTNYVNVYFWISICNLMSCFCGLSYKVFRAIYIYIYIFLQKKTKKKTKCKFQLSLILWWRRNIQSCMGIYILQYIYYRQKKEWNIDLAFLKFKTKTEIMFIEHAWWC